MAATSDAPLAELVDLRYIRADELDPLLDEEARVWQERLEWDFRPSGELVRRFVQMQALSGYALLIGGTVAGYSYHVSEEHKGLIGDLYVLDQFRSAEHEARLLSATVEALLRSQYIRRIEAQLMLLTPGIVPLLPYPRSLHLHERNFMMIPLDGVHRLPPGKAAGRVVIESWSERRHDEAAQLISAAYEGHVDGEINDQYRSISGARRFLMNIVQYPGCGSFFQPASYLAFDRRTGDISGLSLASNVAPDVGHITQICVSPEAKGTGIGYELMRRSLVSLAAHGCRATSLTVTSANENAVRLYEQIGFATRHRFHALVWDEL